MAKNMLFRKYQATGNDFIMVDNRKQDFDFSESEIAALCHRHFGIGADGLILLENSKESDFQMIYYNANGQLGSMCGNGGRTIVRFAYDLGIIKTEKTSFKAFDGIHQAKIIDENIHLQMNDVNEIKNLKDAYFLDTGSPHHVSFYSSVSNLDVYKEGRAIRMNDLYAANGVNVNFVEKKTEDTLQVRTYERGVERETYACGTGVTASAIAAHKAGIINTNMVKIETKGGGLYVCFEPTNKGAQDIWLIGPARFVFKGTL